MFGILLGSPEGRKTKMTERYQGGAVFFLKHIFTSKGYFKATAYKINSSIFFLWVIRFRG